MNSNCNFNEKKLVNYCMYEISATAKSIWIWIFIKSLFSNFSFHMPDPQEINNWKNIVVFLLKQSDRFCFVFQWVGQTFTFLCWCLQMTFGHKSHKTFFVCKIKSCKNFNHGLYHSNSSLDFYNSGLLG